jgi:hypothetical protein
MRRVATLAGTLAAIGGGVLFAAPVASAAPPGCPLGTGQFAFAANSEGGLMGLADIILTGDNKSYSLQCKS